MKLLFMPSFGLCFKLYDRVFIIYLMINDNPVIEVFKGPYGSQ